MSCRLTIEYAVEAELAEKLSTELIRLGWECVYSPKLETPKEVAERFHLLPNTLSKRLREFPGQVIGRSSPTGRILHLHVDERLAEWLRATKTRSKQP
jgi:hypothetical protein